MLYLFKRFGWCIFFGFLFYGCESDVDVKSLTELNKELKNFESIKSFTTFSVSRFKINEERVCVLKEKCRKDERLYSVLLDQIGIKKEIFDSLNNRLDKMNFMEYIKGDNCSIFFLQGGAFGDYGGVVIFDSNSDVLSEFRVNSYTYLFLGEKIAPLVYKFGT